MNLLAINAERASLHSEMRHAEGGGPDDGAFVLILRTLECDPKNPTAPSFTSLFFISTQLPRLGLCSFLLLQVFSCPLLDISCIFLLQLQYSYRSSIGLRNLPIWNRPEQIRTTRTYLQSLFLIWTIQTLFIHGRLCLHLLLTCRMLYLRRTLLTSSPIP